MPPRKKPDLDAPAEYPGTLPKPIVVREAESWRFKWPEETGPESHLVLEFSNTKEQGEGLYSELEVKYRIEGSATLGHIIGPIKVNLTGPRGRVDMTSALERQAPTALWTDGKTYAIRWRDMVELTYRQVVIEFREGLPTMNVVKDVKEEPEVLYMVNRLLPLNQTAVIYCDGGLGKSWLALFIAILVALGYDHPPFTLGRSIRGKCTPVLYLDWEVEEGECRRRVGWILRGLCLIYGYDIETLEAKLDMHLFYRRMERAIHTEASRIRRDVAKYGIGLVIIDSIVPASGGNPNDAEVASAAMSAIRNLYPATRLVVAHISKADAKANGASGGGESGVYGNAFYRNLGRSLWEMKVDKAPGGLYEVGLIHRKVNVGLTQQEFGLSFRWDEQSQAITFSAMNVRDNPQLAKSVGLEAEVGALLLENGTMTEDALRKETKRSDYLIGKALKALEARGEAVKVGGGAGKGNKNTWRLTMQEPENTPLPTYPQVDIDEREREEEPF
jgi:AAA domain